MIKRSLELFCGTKSFTKVMQGREVDCLTLDNDARFEPDYCMDILEFNKHSLPRRWKPDVIWASPPCQGFTITTVYQNWTKRNGVAVPISEKARYALLLVTKTLQIIETLRPVYFFIENPRAMLRSQPIMWGIPRKTVTYCQYGDSRMKPTDIWTNCGVWLPRPMCRPGAKCHESTPRGWRESSTLGLANSIERSVVPQELCEEIVNAIMGGSI